MSNYTISVDWDGKDNLADSNAAKVISGDDFQTEFETVQTAVNSKANLNGSSSEDFAMNNGTAATQSASDNSTKVATTAYVTTAVAALNTAAINAIVYPIGSIYTNMAVATNPATLLGMGTWVAFGEGRVLVGKASSGTFDTLVATGGAETHTLSIAEIPAHTHSGTSQLSSQRNDALANQGRFDSAGTATGSTGGGDAHNNLQPYIVVYMWKRTA